MADQRLVKRINRARIMNAIRVYSPVPRSEIARLLSLDRKSITNIVSELVSEGFVVEAGKRKPEKGRPLTLLEFDRRSHLVLGVSLSEAKVTGELLNFYGESLALSEAEHAFDGSLPDILEAIRTVYYSVKEAAGGRILGVGFSVPGIIDLGSGLVERSVNMSALEGVNIRSAVSDFVAEPLFLEEGSRAKALAEKWFGIGRESRTFVCVDLGIGIGAGIVLDGRLYADGMTFVGEIGHTIVERGGRACRCGHRGCLEAYLSDAVLLAEINEAVAGDYSGLDEVDEVPQPAERVLRDAGRRLGFALSYLVNIICPPLLVLNGGLMRFQDLVMPEVFAGIEEGALGGCLERTRIVASELKNSAALGAGARALSEHFEVEGHFYV